MSSKLVQEFESRISRLYHGGLKNRIPSPHPLHEAVTHARLPNENRLDRIQGINFALANVEDPVATEVPELIEALRGLVQALGKPC